MAKKPRLKLNEDRKYMGIWIDQDTYTILMKKAYEKRDTLSQLVRGLLNDAANRLNTTV